MKRICDEMKTQADESISWNFGDLLTVPGRRALTIGVLLILLNQCSGIFAMLNYTATIFEEAASEMSPNMSAIVVGVIQLLGAFLATNLVDCAGRKVNSSRFFLSKNSQ